MTSNDTASKRLDRTARLRWVSLSKITVNPVAQRELKQYRVDKILANLDLDQIGNPVVNEVNGVFHVIDGQHRIEALRQFGFVDETIQCWVHVGLTDEEEAHRFSRLNDTFTVDSLAKFKVAVTAGYEDESEIDRVVRANGMIVTRDGLPGAIGAVTTLRRVYARTGSAGLGRVLRITHKAYGDPGLESAVIDGLGLLCQRYNGELDEAHAIDKLGSAAGGVNGLLGAAEVIRRKTGGYKSHSVAAAAVEIINRGKGGKKLPDWWKS